MKEQQKHIDAFNLYFTAKSEGATTVDAVRLVVGEYKVSEKTVYKWKREFDWDGREAIRQHQVNTEVVEKTNSALADNKAWYLKINHDMIRKYEESNPTIDNVRDYDALIKTSLQIQGDDHEDGAETRELLRLIVASLGERNIRVNSIGVKNSFDDKD